MLMFKLNSLIYKYIKQAPLFTSCTTVRLGQGRCFLIIYCTSYFLSFLARNAPEKFYPV